MSGGSSSSFLVRDCGLLPRAQEKGGTHLLGVLVVTLVRISADCPVFRVLFFDLCLGWTSVVGSWFKELML